MARGKRNTTRRIHAQCHELNRLGANGNEEIAIHLAAAIVGRRVACTEQLYRALTPETLLFIKSSRHGAYAYGK